MLNVNRVKFLPERTSGVPPVISISTAEIDLIQSNPKFSFECSKLFYVKLILTKQSSTVLNKDKDTDKDKTKTKTKTIQRLRPTIVPFMSS